MKLKLLCISASNSINKNGKESTSFRFCRSIVTETKKRVKDVDASVIELKNYALNPCTNCMQCFEGKRCVIDGAFNEIYKKAAFSDIIFIVSPHYAPIPAKLCMLLEKMEQITFLHWLNDNSYRSELYEIPTGLISHGGAGGDWALGEYIKTVNYPIANALHTIQLSLVPLNDEYKKGISLPPIDENHDNMAYINSKIGEYVEQALSLFNKKV